MLAPHTSKLLLLTAVAMLAAAPAKAELVRFVNPNPISDCGATPSANCASIVQFGALGFGNFPRVLSLQQSGNDNFEMGSTTPSGPLATDVAVTGQALNNGNNKVSAPSLTDLGWTQGSLIAIGFNTNQSGSTGMTLDDLTLNVFNAALQLQGSFSLDDNIAPIQFTVADLAAQQGNGNGLFIFVLDATERAQFNALNPQGNWRIGLFADIGCPNTGAPAGCQPANAGADSFLAVAAGNPVINPTQENPPGVPIPGAVWLFAGGLGLLGMLGIRKKHQSHLAWSKY